MLRFSTFFILLYAFAGMSRDDLEVVGQRSCTSKVRSEEDLKHPQYLGYRCDSPSSLPCFVHRGNSDWQVGSFFIFFLFFFFFAQRVDIVLARRDIRSGNFLPRAGQLHGIQKGDANSPRQKWTEK